MLFPQHHLLILSLTRKASRWCPETKPRLWVLGAPQRPLRSRPRTGGGESGGGWKGGRGEAQPQLPRCYLTAQQPQLRGRGAPRSAPYAPAGGREGNPGPRGASPTPPHRLHGQGSPSAQWPLGLREHLTPRGSTGRTWLSYLKRPCLAPLRPPCPGSILPSLNPLPPSAPKSQP